MSAGDTDRGLIAAQLISELAHELRTPISAISGFAELLRVRNDDRLRQEAADQILSGTARLSQFVDELVATLEADNELAFRFSESRARNVRREAS